MAQKENLIGKLSSDGLTEEWFSREFPDLDDLPEPGTVEESTYTIAKYCDNCNKVLQMYSGIKPIELMLRGGQRNPVLQALLLASVERIPKSTGSGAYANWYDYFGTPGFPGDYPVLECFKGIGGNYQSDDKGDIYNALTTWFGDIHTWIEGLGSQIEAAEQSYIQGEEYTASFDSGTLPEIILPTPGDVDNPSALWQIVKFVSGIAVAWWFPLALEIAKYLFRRATQGEQISPLLKLLRKIFLVKENDLDQGMEDYTSIMLMMIERAIQIIISNNGVNAFLEPTWFEEEQG